MAGSPKDITALLRRVSAGDEHAVGELMPVVYSELRRRASALMRRERRDHTLQSTALVNEAYLRLARQDEVEWQGRAHFFAVAAQQMRRILVDHARSRLRDKRGGGSAKLSLDEALTLSVDQDDHVVAVDEALTRLSELDPRQAQIVEMRFFAGMKVDEVAVALGMSKRAVEAEWTMVRAWLRRELGELCE